MKAIIITIGDEILLGQILDTNSQYISRQLTRLGAEVADILSIADQREGGNLAVGGLRDETGGTDHCDRGIGTNKR